MSRFYIVAVFFLVSISSYAQRDIKQYLDFAKEKYENGDYVYALEYYEKAMAMDSNTIDILWGYAQTLRAYKDYRKAAYYYGKIYRREGARLYPYSLLYYGLMTKQCGNYEKAKKIFNDAIEVYSWEHKGDYLYRKSVNEEKSCKWAEKNDQDTTSLIFEQLPTPSVNTKNAEFVHRSYNGKLYFSSLKADSMGKKEEVYDVYYKTHIYTSQIKNGMYLPSKEVKDVNYENASTGNGTYSLDGKRFYFSYCHDNGAGYQCKILVARVEGDRFKNIDTLGAIINQPGVNTTMPNIGKWMGKEVLFFSSNREGGEGGMDIWYSFIKHGNQYGEPINLKRVNTEDNEVTPFWDSKKKDLYFSSTWYNGFGGYDIFKTHFNTSFGKPKNIGKPYNSPANDLYYFHTKNKDTAYFSSNRLGSFYSKNPTCCSDIYLTREPIIYIPTIKETLEDLNEKLPVTLYFHNDIPNPRSTASTTNINYITTYHNYINRIAEYEKEYSEGLTGAKKQEAIDKIDYFFESKVRQGVRDLDTFQNLLLQELKRGRKFIVTVKGFASPLANTEYNVHLTKRRIASLHNYFHEYNEGVFAPYMDKTAKNGGELILKSVPFGEYEADQMTSDNPNDKSHSVYSRAAALDRKIEIQSVDVIRKGDSLTTVLSANELVFNAGILKSGTPISHTFQIKNIGQQPIEINAISASSSAVTFSIRKKKLAPGKSTGITVYYDTKRIEGYKVASVEIKYNHLDKGLTLSITTQLKK